MNDGEKAAAFTKELREMFDGLLDKYGRDWTEGRVAMLAAVTPIHSATKTDHTGLAACVVGDNILVEQLVAIVALRIGEAYQEMLELPPGGGAAVFLDNVRTNMPKLFGEQVSGGASGFGDKGYKIEEL